MFILIALAQGVRSASDALAIYLLDLLLAFLQPRFDPSLQDDLAADEIEKGGIEDGPALPSQRDDEFRPFVRRLPEWQFWSGSRKLYPGRDSCLIIQLLRRFRCSHFFVVYFCVLFALTMRRQIQHMIKYKYIPWDIGRKARYGGSK
ncbi:hypothetical protein ID866_7420 [Astraeus odoratus]|nr:hypothetical protein ID866_7420 [Astraeus odoratus]